MKNLKMSLYVGQTSSLKLCGSKRGVTGSFTLLRNLLLKQLGKEQHSKDSLGPILNCAFYFT